MKYARESHSAVVHESQLFVFGGQDKKEKSLLGSIELKQLDNHSEGWIEVVEQEDSVCREKAAAVYFRPNQIAIFGGT